MNQMENLADMIDFLIRDIDNDVNAHLNNTPKKELIFDWLESVKYCTTCMHYPDESEVSDCEHCDQPRVHNCESNEWDYNCDDDCMREGFEQAEQYADDAADYAMEQAGGLDAVQEAERQAYFVAKYGEY